MVLSLFYDKFHLFFKGVKVVLVGFPIQKVSRRYLLSQTMSEASRGGRTEVTTAAKP
jgi:hypothetical protein